MTIRTRSGKFERDDEGARNDAEAVRLRAAGLTYRDIAATQGTTLSVAHDRVRRGLAAIPAEAVAELRKVEGARLDAVIARYWGIVDQHHPVLYQGTIVPDVTDVGPVLAALSGILKASESKRKLLGLDAPSRATVMVLTEDVVDAELRRLEAELAARGELAD